MTSPRPGEFEAAVSSGRRAGMADDVWHFLRNSKKWWLLPLVVLLLLVGGLMVLGGTAAAPFIYTLF
jgi:hypothetical protein